MRRFKEVILVAGGLIWCTVLIFVLQNQQPASVDHMNRRDLDKAILSLEELQNQNKQLRKMIDGFNNRKIADGIGDQTNNEVELGLLKSRLQSCLESKDQTVDKIIAIGGVSKEHEVLVRRVENDLVELWYTLKREVKEIKSSSQSLSDSLDSMMQRVGNQQKTALIDVENLSELNSEWREKEAEELQALVQSRIRYLQNPEDCKNTRQLVCRLNKGCGFGCQVHHLAYCFMVAYGTQRTLIIESKNWRYNQEGWEAVFMPASETCREASGPAVGWSGEEETKNIPVVSLPIVDGLIRRPPYLPLGIPEDIAPRLLRLHGNPSVWWVGQLMSYLMRPQAWLQENLDAVERQSGFENPIVGVHVRRTDKVGTEAAFHSVDEYMKHVISWYDKYDLRLAMEQPGAKATRRVYLASDDSSVLPEAREKYPEYIFLGDTEIAESAGLKSRYSKSSLRGVIVDILMLSKCDYLSCTFSSQVCRVAYELMQTLHPDASSYFHSLDDVYYYGGQTGHEQVAVMDHDARPGSQEINMKVGDVMGIAGNHWDGYSKGTNKRTGKVGIYPSYKVKETFKLVKYPTYPEAGER